MFNELNPELEDYYKEIENEMRKIFSEYAVQYPVDMLELNREGVNTRLELLQYQRNLLEQTIEEYENAATDIQEKGFFGFLADELIFNVRGELASIIGENLLTAAISSVIYNDDDFLSQIELVTDRMRVDPEFITLFDTTGSSQTKMNVRIKRNIFEYLYGTIEDLENAIGAGRMLMANTLKGKQATYVWMEKLYGPAKEGKEIPQWRKVNKDGKRVYGSEPGTWKIMGAKGEAYTQKMIEFYYQIMAAELSVMGEKVPFWYLLEYGNKKLSLSTNKGGHAHPEITPYRIIEKSERQISGRLDEAVNEAQQKVRNPSRSRTGNTPYERASEEYSRVLKVCKDQITASKESLKFVEGLISRIIDFHVEEEPLAVERELWSIDEAITDRFTKDLKRAEATERVTKAADLRISLYINQIIAGQLPEGKRVYVGYAQGRRKSMRTVQLSQQVADTLKKYSESTEDIQDIAERSIEFYREQLQKMKAIRSRK